MCINGNRRVRQRGGNSVGKSSLKNPELTHRADPAQAVDPTKTEGPSSCVDTKPDTRVAFGNDGNSGSANVDTKSSCVSRFGNDGVGFIRVRKRKLNGGHPLWAYRARASKSFDLVKAVRIDGKPRHKFVLGLGSQKDTATGRDAAYLLLVAIGRMKSHGLNEPQRRALLTELIRKGVRRPTITECEGWNLNSGWTPHVDELVAWLRGTGHDFETAHRDAGRQP
jgi:hypothetical protein